MFLMYLLQRLECFVDMSLRGELREEDATNNSLSVDDACHAPRQSESCGHAVALSDYSVHITQQNEREMVLFCKLLMRLLRVGTDTDDFSTSLLDRKSTRLNSSHCALSRMPSSA